MKEVRQEVLNRWRSLVKERDPYLHQWIEISKFLRPANGKFLNPTTQNEAKTRWNNIYDNTAFRASDILAKGLMSGMTDPSQQWFFLTTGSPDLDESVQVRRWLSDVSQILYMTYAKTNLYQALHHAWLEAGLFGILAIIIEEDEEKGFNCIPLTAGEYCISCDSKGTPDTIYREFSLSLRQIVQKFGEDALPYSLYQTYQGGQEDKLYTIIHAIEPREKRDTRSKSNKDMPWRSVYLLKDAGDDQKPILRESGYRMFPAVVGRWGAISTETYSCESPGMVVLGDVKQLQHEQKQKGNAIDYMVNPPIGLPSEAKDSDIDMDPGGQSFINGATGRKPAEQLWNVAINLNDLRQDTLEVQNRIRAGFNVDMFLMLSNQSALNQMTATAVAELHEENLLMLGPVLSRFNNEVLRPLIDRTFDILNEEGLIPPAPEEIQGTDLNVEYTSILSRSQKEVQSRTDQQAIQEALQIAQYQPDFLDNFDLDKYAQIVSDKRGVSPEILRSSDEVAAIRQQRAQQKQQAQQQQQMAQSADMLSKLGKVPAGPETLAGQAVQGMQDMAAEGMQ